jgi:hypothetical protein
LFTVVLFVMFALLPSHILANTVTPNLNADPDSESQHCIAGGDVQCMVDVWANQFKLKPYDDTVRQEYWAALMLETLRMLDTGGQYTAGQALAKAKDLLPDSQSYSYLDGILSKIDRPTQLQSMETSGPFAAVHRTDFESQYAQLTDVLGGKTTAFALTQKQAGYVNGYHLSSGVYGDIDYRIMVYPTSRNGTIYINFGSQDDGSYFSLELDLAPGYSAEARIAHFDGSNWENLSDTQYITMNENKWHNVEVRIIGQSVTVFVDYTQAVSQVVLAYTPGTIGFEVGLPNYKSGSTFSVAFDDITVYKLKSV